MIGTIQIIDPISEKTLQLTSASVDFTIGLQCIKHVLHGRLATFGVSNHELLFSDQLKSDSNRSLSLKKCHALANRRRVRRLSSAHEYINVGWTEHCSSSRPLKDAHLHASAYEEKES